MYYAIINYNPSSLALDMISWIDIPPLEYNIVTTPDPIIIRQGEQSIVGIQLSSSSTGGLISQVMGMMPLNTNNSTIEIKRVDIAKSNGESYTTSNGSPELFKVRVSRNTPIGKYTIPVLANVSTGSLFPTRSLNLRGFDIPLPASGSTVKLVNIPVNVIEPLTTGEQVKQFWSEYGAIISLIGAGFIGALTQSIIKYFRTHVKMRKVSFKFGDYHVHHVTYKSLCIKKGHHSVIFYDIAQSFDKSSLANTYESNIGKLPEGYLEFKSKRSEFTLDSIIYQMNISAIQNN